MLYLQARGWGVQPEQFWNMTLPEWFLECDANRPRTKSDFAGSLTQGDVERLTQFAMGD